MTPLHEDLHNKLNRYHEYVPNTLLFTFLKDTTEDQMVLTYSKLYIIVFIFIFNIIQQWAT